MRQAHRDRTSQSIIAQIHQVGAVFLEKMETARIHSHGLFELHTVFFKCTVVRIDA